ncbi:MAG: DNA/RNA non-specific endonuclease [Leptothrix ochracea]|uniref:DNA/RNA non-specific endonuclease n=1 Tax=Leptothrix ochracea TaxID=735331 RepID=UPI0034E25ED2
MRQGAHVARSVLIGLIGWLSLISLPLLLSCGGGGGNPAAVTPAPVTVTHPSPVSYGSDTVITQDYGGFKLLYDCTEHTALRYEYPLGFDTGYLPRPANFTFDPSLPAGCGQQTSTATYASVVNGWDRGHLVMSNHMDDNATFLLRANYMTNVVPQVGTFNRGIWLDAENVAECYRDIAPLTVYGGVVYTDPSNDVFLASHGIRTPDWFWKAIVSTDPLTQQPIAIAWVIPNQSNLGPLDSYLVSLDELDQQIGASMVAIAGVPADVRASKPVTTWPLPANCSFARAAGSAM